ncbi:PHP domain protein [Trichophyton verrucosum HKI 0517]|uniref:PHP domain protein n=1 Tax=Trichophyton verrucosum (strain HKI 0517) TaxID=663202 RepID=D4D4G2_TRIVH|nr:PHP domain protein [Trichophyton verrucosum HKI 0517]EFE43309.1 PHP domain protein [Trichophyton verrucosum HKI 0517]
MVTWVLISFAVLICAAVSTASVDTNLLSIRGQQPIHLNLTGHIPAEKVLDFVFVDFDVPEGTTSISVLQKYSLKGKGNALDLGCWDQRGHHLALEGNFTTGFRGWSGGARDNFTITPEYASPGYIAGAIQPGVWSVALGPYNSVPQGIDYELKIKLGFEPVKSYFQPAFAPSRIDSSLYMNESGSNIDQLKNGHGQPGLQWYRGDFHIHTIYSDGKQTPQRVAELAQQANLSFFFSTDHNTQSSGLIWGAVAPPSLLVGRGIEVTTRGGHWNALGLNWNEWVEFRYKGDDSTAISQAVRQVQRQGGLAVANHPFANDCLACDWSFSFDIMDGLEVWNGIWNDFDRKAVDKWHSMLVQGSRVFAIGGSDYHSSPSAVGTPTTVVRSESLSTAQIVDSLRHNRAYIVRDPGIDIQFTLSHQGETIHIGDKVNSGKENKIHGPISAVLEVKGLPANAVALFISDKGVLRRQTISQADHVLHARVDSKHSFIRVEVQDPTGSMLAMTNPIWT